MHSISKFSYKALKSSDSAQPSQNNPIVSHFNLNLPNGCPSPHQNPTAFRSFANDVMDSFFEKWSSETYSGGHDFFRDLSSLTTNATETTSNTHSVSENSDTLLIPSIQMGPLSIKHDEHFTKLLFDTIDLYSKNQNACRTDMTSGYFNLANMHKNAILNSSGCFNLIIASPEANGFYGASGISGHIPNAYSMFELEFISQVINKNRSDKVKVYEFSKKGWTYHAKGFSF
ncbi:CDP-diacylglycerol-glycerol-3-phosphate 3-phosphatidyltransferase, mitochondrial [Smittium mucronatum]|uniref:CDP-diacylglycerol--glycerol-3-phosphate 3-phosphatidyltransferase n=1 Tax=Smittium mucronatum TaxID=133383 RepID=A0A1R0H7T1_9FUNG|nr:CDP-diacylglycerol-glycerol-3-phosphate 3-phosphatidyltransferase, mitochondrial [Smittium mucronatum]